MGMTVFEKLRTGWNLGVGRYRAQPVDSEALRQGCEAVLRRVREDELHRSGSSLPVALYRPDAPIDDVAVALIDTRTDAVVGTTRLTRMTRVQAQPDIAPDFQFDAELLGDLLPHAWLGHRFAIDPAHRKTGASYLMMQDIYARAQQHGALFCLGDCEPPLVRLYQRLGFRPVGRPYTRGGIVFIALVLVLHDIDHLRRVRSPFLGTWRAIGRPTDPRGPAWIRSLQERGALPTSGFAVVDPEEEHDGPLFAGVSARGRAALLAYATRVELAPGQVVMRDGDAGRWMGVVERGLLEASVGDRLVGLLGPNDVIGELGFLLQARRTADMAAGPDGATVMMLSPGALDRVDRAPDREQLWRNLARIVAYRLAERNGTSLGDDGEPVEGAGEEGRGA